MRKWLIAFFVCVYAFPIWAETSLDLLLNKVSLQLTADQWIMMKTALVTIGMNAAMGDGDLGKMQNNMMNKLNQLSKAEWHIISFNRSLDQSGLENIQASAQARLSPAELAGLRDKTKAISKAGETFTLDAVDFIPSDEEIRAAKTILRNAIYQQARNAELTTLNKLYPDQKFYLHDINFTGMLTPIPLVRTENLTLMRASANKVNNASSLTVGNKLNMTAIVVFASAPNQDVIKMIHN